MNKIRIFQLFFIGSAFFLLSLLTGCASTTSAPVSSVTPHSHEDKLSDLSHWKTKGKMGASNGSEGASASFVWRQQGPAYTIKFFGPLGMGAANLKGNTQSKQVVLQESSGKITKAASPESLVYQATGLYLPVSGLQYWIKGQPNPNQSIDYSVHNKVGLVTQLGQGGWQMLYSDYIEHEKGLFLPTKVKMINQANNNIFVKLVIHSWDS